jgi:hypothetical protein
LGCSAGWAKKGKGGGVKGIRFWDFGKRVFKHLEFKFEFEFQQPK